MPYPSSVDVGQITPWYLAHEMNALAFYNGTGAPGLANYTVLMGVYNPTSAIITNFRTRHGAVSAGNVDMGLYDTNGNLLGHTGKTAVSAVNTDQTLAPSGGPIWIAQGRYYLAFWSDSNTDTYYVVGVTSIAEANVGALLNTKAPGLPATFAAAGGFTLANGLRVIGMMATLAGTGF